MAIEQDPYPGFASRGRSHSVDSITSEMSIPHKQDERTPLLGKRASQDIGEVIDIEPSTGSSLHPRTIIALILLVVMIFTLGDTIQDTPQKRIFESIYCYQYWEEHDPTKLLLSRADIGPGAIGGVEEKWCKVATIQSQVASLRGWQIFFDGIPALLVAIPFGILADRIGRKPIVWLGIFSFLLRTTWMQFICWFWQAFPLKLIWLSSLHGLISGSSPVVSAIAITIVSDVTDDSTRSLVFLCVSASNMVMYFIGPPLGAWLMTINPWIPFFLASLILALTLLLFSFCPETLNYTHPTLKLSARDLLPLAPDAALSATIPEPHPAPISTSFPARLATFSRSFLSSTAFLRTDSRIALCLLPFIAAMIAQGSAEVLLQYASTRFAISYAAATFYISITAGVKVLVLLLLYPSLGAVMTKRLGFSGLRKDLVIARWAMVLACLGWVLTGFTTSIGTFIAAELLVTLSYGGGSLARSFVTGIVRRDDVAKLYTCISVVDTVALMGGGPAMAGLWEWGVTRGEAVWMGAPFWVQGGLYALVAVGLGMVGVRKGEEGEEEGEEARV
ncbi:Efflux pump-like protein 8 [Elsinoe fawcettii]|nr:Efflux pump-like protein 8 [Elsinoe fawcettii]